MAQQPKVAGLQPPQNAIGAICQTGNWLLLRIVPCKYRMAACFQRVEALHVLMFHSLTHYFCCMQAFTEEQRAELHAVEAQIRRRIAIGSTVSERKLKVCSALLSSVRWM